MGDTELHWAAFRGHDAILERLLRGGEPVDKRVESGSTALHLAAYNGHSRSIAVLLGNGADINARTDEGITPLDWAQSNDHKKATALLLAHGAKVGKGLSKRKRSFKQGKKGGDSGSNPGRFLQAESGQYRQPPPEQLEEIPIERRIENEELEKLESVSRINEILENYRASRNSIPPISAPESVQPVEPSAVKMASVAETPSAVQEPSAVNEPSVVNEPSAVKKSSAVNEPVRRQKIATKDSSGSAHRAQLAAMSSVTVAAALQQEYGHKHSELFRELDTELEVYSEAGQNIHRVRSGLLTEDEAYLLCSQLRERAQDCFVVRP